MYKLILILILIFSLGCFDQKVEEINFENIEDAPYSLQTLFYGIQIEIDSRINPIKHATIMQRIDQETIMFYACQFQDAEVLPMSTHEVTFIDCKGDGINKTVFKESLENLRIYITKYTFFCVNAPSKACDGQVFRSSNLIIVEQSLRSLGEELAHGEGLCSNHSNRNEFMFCI